MSTNTRPPEWGADGETRVFILAVLLSCGFWQQALETAPEDFRLSADSERAVFQQNEA
jgi:hypothetical protein